MVFIFAIFVLYKYSKSKQALSSTIGGVTYVFAHQFVLISYLNYWVTKSSYSCMCAGIFQYHPVTMNQNHDNLIPTYKMEYFY